MFYLSRRLFSSAAQKGGTLFTWGKSTTSLGRPETGKTEPKPLKGINNVVKACMGISHSAIITADGYSLFYSQQCVHVRRGSRRPAGPQRRREDPPPTQDDRLLPQEQPQGCGCGVWGEAHGCAHAGWRCVDFWVGGQETQLVL